MTAEIWDVIIVGAGLSGLSAAHLLMKRNTGLKILILEGKGGRIIPFCIFLTKAELSLSSDKMLLLADRVGGRTLTAEIPAAGGADHWDFGGQWVGR